MSVLSYAKHFEDARLNRAFKGKRQGFYLDLGVLHSDVFSITRWFYELGWSGINLEPTPSIHRMLTSKRPRDINLPIAAGASLQIVPFGIPSATGAKPKTEAQKILYVELRPLREICAQYCEQPLDFLAFDVSRFGIETLEGADFLRFKPVVVVIKNYSHWLTELSGKSADAKHRQHLLAMLQEQSYHQAYDDGCNLFFCRCDDHETCALLSRPADESVTAFTLPNYAPVTSVYEMKPLFPLSSTEAASSREDDQVLSGLADLLVRNEATISDLQMQNAELSNHEKGLFERCHHLELTTEAMHVEVEKHRMIIREAERTHSNYARLFDETLNKKNAYIHKLKERLERQEAAQQRNQFTWITRLEQAQQKRFPFLLRFLLPKFVLSKLPAHDLQSFRDYMQEPEYMRDLPDDMAVILSESCSCWHSLQHKLTHDAPLRVVFVNDLGFAHGAGIAMRRQAMSFIGAKHRVGLVANVRHGHLLKDLYNDPLNSHFNWMGTKILPRATIENGYSQDKVARAVLRAVASFTPDLVIFGNLHGVSWPDSIVEKLHAAGSAVVVYGHDCDWLTAGCAYPQYYNCTRYVSGCVSSNCPKPTDAYPVRHEECPLEESWLTRQRLFATSSGVALATNSRWNAGLLHERFGEAANIGVVPLAVDTTTFKPADKSSARRRLLLDPEAFYVLVGSENNARPGKGFEFIAHVVRHFSQDQSRKIKFLSFGQVESSEQELNIHSLGYVTDQNRLVDAYRAADVFLTPVTIEAFGQTMLEASACGLPIVCFPVCGVSEIAHDGVNALYAKTADTADLIRQMERLYDDSTLRTALGEGGRKIALSEYTLDRQYENWVDFLKKTAAAFCRQ